MAPDHPRAYRLHQDEPLPEAIRRVARGRIDHALDELSGKTDSAPDRAVHEARKDMKKLRSLLRLARGELGDERYRRENDCFREVAGTLSGARDADVMLATLAGLDSEPAGLPSALERHRQELRASGHAAHLQEAVAVLEGARERIDDWPLEHGGFDALAPGLERAYRRGRRAMQAVAEEPTSQALHDWRKRSKDRWYHLTLLGEAWPAPLHAEADEAHALADLLGDDHDLAVLEDWTHEHIDADLGDFDAEVDRRRSELQAEALAVGRRLYAERPGAFRHRLERLWLAARSEAAART